MCAVAPRVRFLVSSASSARSSGRSVGPATLDRKIDVLLGRRRAIGAGDAQGGQGQHRPGPGSEILRGEFAPGDLADVLVDVGRIDRLPLAGFVDVLEELVARQLLTAPHDGGHAPVVDVDGVELAALPAELEAQALAANTDVAAPERRQPVGAVVARVLRVPDPDERGLQEVNDGREHLLALVAGAPHVQTDPAPNAGQRAAELGEPGILCLITDFTPARMVPVLLSPASIAAHGLDVTGGRGTDPHVRPRRRNGDRADSLKRLRIGHLRAVGARVLEAAPDTDALDAGPRVAHVEQSRRRGGLDRAVGGRLLRLRWRR